jgi:copper transport protein
MAIVKWANLTGLVLWLGGLFFWLWIFTPALTAVSVRSLDQRSPVCGWARKIRRAIGTGIILVLAAQPVALIIQGMAFTGLSAGNVLSRSTLGALLATTSYGFWWSLRALLVLLLAGLCAWWFRPLPLDVGADGATFVSRSQMPLSVGGGLLGGATLLSLPLTGHARAASGAMSIAVWSDWAHLASTVIWIGGLILMWAGLPGLDMKSAQDSALARAVVVRFAAVARICVLVLLASGIYAAWLHIPAWAAFLTTNYGRTLLVKLSLVVLMLIIAGINRRFVLPAFRELSPVSVNDRRWMTRLPALLATETVLGVAVLAVVAMLTGLAPSSAALPAKPAHLSQRNQGVNVRFLLNSNKVGQVEATVTLQDSSGRTIKSARPVTVYERMLDMDMGLKTIQGRLAADGSYKASLDFSMAGRWQVSVEASGESGDAFVTEFEVSAVP